MSDSSAPPPAAAGASPASPDAQKAQLAGPNRVLLVALVCFLCIGILLAIGIWLTGPAWYIRLVGKEAQGVAVTQDCDDGTVATWVLFQDAQGQLHEIPPEDTCTNFYQDGEQLSVWYLPNNPTSELIGGGSVVFLYVFTAIELVIGLVLLPGFLVAVRQLISACIQAESFAHLGWLALGCLLILALLAESFHLWPPSGAHPDVGPTRDFHVGETVSVDGRWTVTVQGAQVARVGGAHAPDAAGSVCLELDLTLRNATDQPLAFDMSQFTLYDTQEQAITTSCSIDATRLANAKLAPGAVIKGALAYRVPASLRQCYLGFQPDPDNAPTVGRDFWRLQVTPAGRISEKEARIT